MRGALARLAVLSHSAVEPDYQRKWKLIARSGWRILLMVPPRWPEAGRTVRARARRSGRLEVKVVRSIGVGKLAGWTPLGLQRRLAAFRPDLVHAEEEPFGLACWSAARAAAKLEVPFTWFTWENLDRRYRFWQRGLLRSVLPGSAGMIGGNAQAVGVMRRWGFRGKTVVIPQYGVDTARFRPLDRRRCRRKLGWPARGPTVGYVGRLLPEKGVDVLVRAVARLPAPVRLVLVGSGPDRDRLAALARRLLPGRVSLVPAVPRRDVPVLLGGMDVLVLPSRTTPAWKEQFGRIAVEALACGRPVLGSSSGEIPRVLPDRSLVFPEGRVDRLASAMARWLRRSPGRLPEPWRRRTIDRFSEAVVAERTHEFLRDVSLASSTRA